LDAPLKKATYSKKNKFDQKINRDNILKKAAQHTQTSFLADLICSYSTAVDDWPFNLC
jgi:hypothetical protein